MQTVSLGPTGRTTTRLGFGCSSIMGALNRRQSLELLETAYEAGVRHFDTAPMYGYGEAESCLGQFLGRHRHDITITTKFGIPAAPNKQLIRAARAIVGPVVQRLPALKKLLQGAAQAASRPAPQPEAARAPNPIFTGEQARASLAASLVALRTDHIDIWLLHDVAPIDLAAQPENDPLLRVLEDSVREGKVGAFGVGTDREHIAKLWADHPQYCPVTQYEWSVLNAEIPPASSFRIHHRALSAHFQAIVSKLQQQPAETKRWSEEVGADLSKPGTLAHLMLKASLVFNPDSVILFSSKNSSHIHTNIAVAGDATLEGPARRLHQILQALPLPLV